MICPICVTENNRIMKVIETPECTVRLRRCMNCGAMIETPGKRVISMGGVYGKDIQTEDNRETGGLGGTDQRHGSPLGH